MAVNYMNIQQLRCIVEIARVGSITKAAENLYMNQPNLSRTVIEFEKEYGITLFIRNSQGVILTDSGKKVVEKAEEIIKKTNDLNRFLYNNDKETINVKLAGLHPRRQGPQGGHRRGCCRLLASGGSHFQIGRASCRERV